MNENFEDMFKPLKDNISLSHNERILMRNDLQTFLSEHPAKVPLRLRIFGGIGLTGSMKHSWKPVVAALLLVAFAGTGTSYAAESALPGDALYLVKIDVNEALQGALITSTAGKADWDATLADKRLQEAETLAAQGRLTAANAAIVQTQLTNVSNNFNANVAALAQSQGTTTEVALVQSDMEASLNAHADVLAALDADLSGSQPALAPILKQVRIRALALALAREKVEGSFATSTTVALREAASTNQGVAESQLKNVRALIKAEISTIGTSSALQASAVASDTQETINSADQNFAAGDYGEAFSALLGAIQTEQETRIGLSAAENLKAGGHIDVDSLNSSATSSSDSIVTATSTLVATSTSLIPGE